MEATPAPSGGCWTVQEVTDAATAHCAIVVLEHRLLIELLEGTCTDVDPAQLQVLAATFAVPPEYLLGSAEQVDAIDAELELAQALRDSGARDLFVCTRGGGELNTEGRRRIAEMIRSSAAASRAGVVARPFSAQPTRPTSPPVPAQLPPKPLDGPAHPSHEADRRRSGG